MRLTKRLAIFISIITLVTSCYSLKKDVAKDDYLKFANLSKPISGKFNDLNPMLKEYISNRNKGANDTILLDKIKLKYSELVEYIDFAIDSANRVSPVDEGFKEAVLDYLDNCKIIIDNEYKEMITLVGGSLEDNDRIKISKLGEEIMKKLQMAEIILMHTREEYRLKYKIDL